MYSIPDYRDCLERLTGVFTGLGIPFGLTGGAAFIAYGDPRTTQDVDFVVHVARLCETLPQLILLLKQNGFLVSEQAMREAIASQRQFQLLDQASALKVDLYPRELIPGELGRAVSIEVMPGLTLPVVSIPDLVVSKLIWISKGSHKSRRDVRQLMRTASAEERRMVDEFAAPLQVEALLREVLAEPDEIDF